MAVCRFTASQWMSTFNTEPDHWGMRWPATPLLARTALSSDFEVAWSAELLTC
jgi:hypothetical protein